MTSDAVKIARSNERVAMVNAVKDIVTNPLLVCVGTFFAIEWFQGHNEIIQYQANGQTITENKHVAGGGWMGSNAGNVAEVVLGASALTAAMTPNFKALAEQLGPIAQSLAPLMLTKGMG